MRGVREGEGWSSTFTGDDGTFELVGGPGKWEITIYRPYDTKVDWVYEEAPKRVSFKKDSSKRQKPSIFQSPNFPEEKLSGVSPYQAIKMVQI